MNDIHFPKTWSTHRLVDLAKFIDYRGRTPKKTPEGVPLITAKNIRNGYINREPQEYISPDAYDSWMTRGIPKLGDVVITTEAPLGNVAVIELTEKFALAQRAICLQFYLDGISSYIHYALRAPDFQKALTLNSTGTTVSGIKAATLKQLSLPIPPLAEQKVIAEKLDTLLAQVETTKARLESTLETLKQFRQSVLASAITGNLTDEFNSTDSDYYDLLNAEINSSNKLKRVSPLKKDEISAAKQLFNSEFKFSWQLYPLEQLVHQDRGIPYGIVQTGDAQQNGIPTIRCGDVKALSVDMSQLKLVHPDIEDKYSRTRLIGGEVILAIRGSVGNAAVVTSDMVGDGILNISREVAMIPVRDTINPHYIAFLLQSPGGYRCLAEKTRGVAQRGINLADVKRLVTPVPSREEQNEIVRRVRELFAGADATEKQVNQALERVKNLTQSILAKAFRGELTEQWRKDNPELISGDNSAEALLTKIKAEREAAKPKRKTNK